MSSSKKDLASHPGQRIVHLISGLGVGGAERTLQSLVGKLDQLGFDSFIISLSDLGEIGRELIDSGFQVTALNWRSGAFSPVGFARLLRKISQINPFVLQTWMYHADFVGALASFWLGDLPLIWNVRGTGIDRHDLSWRTRLLIRANACLSRIPSIVIYNSNRGQRGHEQLGYKPKACEVIVNGIDGGKYYPDEDAGRQIRRQLGVSDQAFLLGTVGRYHPVKGYDLLLEAFSQVVEAHSAIYLVMIGQGLASDNEHLVANLRQTGLENRIKLVGMQPNLNSWYNALDAFILPSLSEGFPNVVVEAMACQKPCIVTDVGDAATIVGDLGIITPPGNVASLVKAIKNMIARSSQDRLELGTASRRRVLDTYSQDVMVAKYERLYRQSTQPGS